MPGSTPRRQVYADHAAGKTTPGSIPGDCTFVAPRSVAGALEMSAVPQKGRPNSGIRVGQNVAAAGHGIARLEAGGTRLLGLREGWCRQDRSDGERVRVFLCKAAHVVGYSRMRSRLAGSAVVRVRIVEMAIANPVAEPAAIKGGVQVDGWVRMLDHELIAEDVAISNQLADITGDRRSRSDTAQQQRANEILHDAITASLDSVELILPSGAA